MAFLISALCLLAASGGPVAGAVVKGTLVVGVLKIESSYAHNVEQPAGRVPDTIQMWIGPDRAWRIRTHAIDHDIHVYSLGQPKQMKREPTDFARDHIKKHYGDVLRSLVVLRFDDASNALASRRVLSSQGLDGTLEVAKDGFAFWNPDDGVYQTKSEPEAPTTFERWLGRKTIGVLQTGTKVEVFVLGPMPVGPRGYLDDNTGNHLPPGTPATVQRYPVRRVAANQGRRVAQEIARLVLDEHSYDPRANPFGRSIVKGCALAPLVAFRVWAKGSAVDVLLCFNCDQVGVADVGGTRDIAVGDIDPVRPAFVRLVKSVLADVPEVAKLSASRTD